MMPARLGFITRPYNECIGTSLVTRSRMAMRRRRIQTRITSAYGQARAVWHAVVHGGGHHKGQQYTLARSVRAPCSRRRPMIGKFRSRLINGDLSLDLSVLWKGRTSRAGV